MKNIVAWLSGKKTHIVAVLLVLVAIVQFVTGDMSLVEFLNSDSLWVLLNGLGLSGLRAAVQKI